jgi:hypothetical protein
MTTKSHRLATGAAVVVIGAAGPSVIQASVAIVDDDVPVVTVVDEGDPSHRVLLSGPATSGAMADSTTNFGTDIAVSGQGFPIDIDLSASGNMMRTTEVRNVETDGAYSTGETLTSFNLSTASAGSTDPEELDLDGSATTDFAPLVDVPFIVAHSTTGGVSVDPQMDDELTEEQLELADELVESGFAINPFVALPSIPVGQGAVWTVAEPGSSASTVVPLALSFTLVSLKGDVYTIDIGLEGDVLEQLGGGDPDTEVTGEVTLTGTLTGDASNVLDQQLTMDLLMDVTVSDAEITLDLDAEISIDHASTPR